LFTKGTLFVFYHCSLGNIKEMLNDKSKVAELLMRYVIPGQNT